MNDKDRLAVGFMEKPYMIVKADSGGIRFSISIDRGRRDIYCFYLLKKECPHEPAYLFKLSENSSLIHLQTQPNTAQVQGSNFKIHNFYNQNTHDFWLTWFNNEICLGKLNEPALLKYAEVNSNNAKIIGFVKFYTYISNGRPLEWNVECTSPIYTKMRTPVQVNGGELRWVRMDSSATLPVDALIGGLEDEPLYIARAKHNGSLCVGKYVKSKQLAFIPWGHTEHAKNEFEVLCGYDAMWIKTHGGHIPENAFIGGYSEVRHEPLFVGRAWVGNHLIVGKVHLLYKTCYLPYREREVEVAEYEALVIGNKVTRSESTESPCYMNMIMQPCERKHQ